MNIIDMHCDTIYEILEARKRGETLSLRNGNLMVNLEKMKQSRYCMQSFALYIEQEPEVSSFEKADALLSIFKEEMRENQDWISQVTTVEELQENKQKGKMSAFLTIEGGEACEGSLDKLYYFYNQGVRLMTLTWNFPNEIGYPNFRKEEWWNIPDTEHGLTSRGKEIVQEMERLGMLVDVSHLSDKGYYDVLELTEKPFVASHSNARSLCSHVRNMTDDMIRKLANRGGVMGLNYHCKFLDNRYNTDSGMTSHIGNTRDYQLFLQQKKEIHCQRQKEILECLVRHAKHIVNVGGIECLGLGSDFDGIPAYAGMPLAEDLWNLAEIMKKHGFHESDVERIFRGNVMRVYMDVLK